VISAEVRERVAARFESRFLRGYVRGKVASDPVYEAVVTRLRVRELPLLDIGCGIGLLSFVLRETGYTASIVGIDHDAAKIDAARSRASSYEALTFELGDARAARVSFSGNVTLLDLLHYFRFDERQQILRAAIASTAPGGVVILRDCVRDDSWRYQLTRAQESFSRLVRWLKAERLEFPTREEIAAPFREAGFSEEIVPLWGRTPFNNYLFTFRRPATS
jgi:2-polyprenyl-3-methyl-5-hydroxy-6-metoxy-1,4-benzoquinol methylase